MGFRRKSKTYTIKFSGDSDWAGLEVVASGMNIDEWLEIFGMGGNVSTPQALRGVQMFSGHVLSWNLEDEQGNPVKLPSLNEGAEDPAEELRKVVLREDRDMLFAIAGEWVTAASGVATPLEPSSTDTELPPEASLPTETL